MSLMKVPDHRPHSMTTLLCLGASIAVPAMDFVLREFIFPDPNETPENAAQRRKFSLTLTATMSACVAAFFGYKHFNSTIQIPTFPATTEQEMLNYCNELFPTSEASWDQSFDSFLIQQHPYSAVGPSIWTFMMKKSEESYIDGLRNFDVVVNLISSEKEEVDANYLNLPYFKGYYNYTGITTGSTDLYQSGTKKLYHFPLLKDGGEIDIDMISSIMDIALEVVNCHKSNKVPLIHCRAGVGRTSCFIILCECLHYGNRFVKLTNNEVRGYIFYIAMLLKNKNPHRHPNHWQMARFFQDDFINALRTKIQSQIKG